MTGGSEILFRKVSFIDGTAPWARKLSCPGSVCSNGNTDLLLSSDESTLYYLIGFRVDGVYNAIWLKADYSTGDTVGSRYL